MIFRGFAIFLMILTLGLPAKAQEKLVADLDQRDVQITTDFNGAELNLIDGLRIEYPSGWGLVRASNTTPCLTLRFEADDPKALLQIQQLVKQAMLSVDANLELPF